MQQYMNKVAAIQGDRSITFAQLDERANRLANALISLGMQTGDRLAIMSRNCPQFREVYLSVIKAGLVLVPLNFRQKETEISYIINDCQPATIIFQSEYADLITSTCSGATFIKNLICVQQAKGKMMGYEDLISKHPPTEPEVKVSEDNLVLLMYTSGTTGQPKGVMTPRSTFTRFFAKNDQVYGDASDSVCLSVMPMHGSAGLMTDMRFLVFGGTTIISESSAPATLLSLIEKYRVAETNLVPTSINFLLNAPEFGKHDISSLKKICYTGSYMLPELLERAIKAMGNIFIQIYGSTETIGISILSAEEHILGSKKITSAGRLQPGVQLKIVDDKGKKVPLGEKGEILVKSDTMMKGYFGKPEATAETLEDGWCRTGDIGFVDEDGYIYIRDRKKDMIISGGTNIYPAEIENIILSHPAVLEVAVIGIPDAAWGESIKAVIVPKEGAKVSEEEIIELCKSKLASYKKPKSVDFVKNLPKTSTGKVQKWMLRKKLK